MQQYEDELVEYGDEAFRLLARLLRLKNERIEQMGTLRSLLSGGKKDYKGVFNEASDIMMKSEQVAEQITIKRSYCVYLSEIEEDWFKNAEDFSYSLHEAALRFAKLTQYQWSLSLGDNGQPKKLSLHDKWEENQRLEQDFRKAWSIIARNATQFGDIHQRYKNL